MDKVLAEEGEEKAQETFERIWTGFLAFDALGTLGKDLVAAIQKMHSARSRVIDMMNAKAQYGSQNHLDKRLGSSHINKLFADPAKFVDELASSAWVVPGNPDASPIMNYLTSFQGPMFKVFSEEDLEKWRNWIWSLKSNVLQKGRVDSYGAMREVMRRLAKTARAVKMHDFVLLRGPSPNQPAMVVEQSVTVWLQTVHRDPIHIMRTLANPDNGLIECGEPMKSPFITRVLAPGTTMGGRYANAATEAVGKPTPEHAALWTHTDIVSLWIQDGCPMQKLPDATFNLFPPAGEYTPTGLVDAAALPNGRFWIH